MTRMTGLSLAVGLLGRTGTGQMSLNNHLTGATYTGRGQNGARGGHITAGQR